MPEISAVIEQLRLHFQNDSTLQHRLFEIRDEREFSAAISQLCASLGYLIEPTELLQAIQQGRRAWLERDLP